MNKIYNCYLLLGTNLGNKENNLLQAKAFIVKHCGRMITQSSIYETAAWGVENQPHFLNQVIQIETQLQPQHLMATLLQIEQNLGRIRTTKMGARTIDIDILLIDDLIIEEKNLQVPHPRMQDRKFVLLPLSEIGGNIIHPILLKSNTDLLKLCTDNLDVKKFY
jgi:2-amino-4-hydroxy-6-hydroxymethyldihydropteridine diphosphokinase